MTFLPSPRAAELGLEQVGAPPIDDVNEREGAPEKQTTRTLQIEHARAFLPMLVPQGTYRYYAAYGGRGSGKSHEFAKKLIRRCLENPGTRWVCIREVQMSLRESVKRLLEDYIILYGVGHLFQVMESEIRTPGGGVIIFQGMQNHTAESIKSLEGFDGAWVEEAQTLSASSLKLLRPTIRKPKSEMWFSWNPRKKSDPVDEMFRGGTPPESSIVIGTTFEDNPWFPEVLRADMLWDKARDFEEYEHVWLGKYERHSKSRVFRNFVVEEFTTPAGVIYYSGADWGYSIDPATLVRAFVEENDPKTGKPWTWTSPDTGDVLPRARLYIDADLYAVGVEIDHLPAFFDQMDNGRMRQWPIVADSSRPDTISYLRRHGYPRMEAAKKGLNSVKEGVQFLQSYHIIIHPRCTATVKEFEEYSYKVDPKTDVVSPVLEDKKNHIIDPVRYAVEQLRGAMKVKKAKWG